LPVQIIVALTVVLLSTVGQLEERTHARTGQFIEQAQREADLDGLEVSCVAGAREEKRYWLIGEQGVVYMLDLKAPTLDLDYGGEFLLFHRSKVVRLHHRRTYDWAAVAELLAKWDADESGMFASGQRSFLSLVIESCRGSFYQSDTFWDLADRPVREQRAATSIKGIILSLDAPTRIP
jgi:hypothetical protein